MELLAKKARLYETVPYEAAYAIGIRQIEMTTIIQTSILALIAAFFTFLPTKHL